MNLRDTTIAVTGASGLLGRALTRDLLTRGAKVRAVVRSPEKMAWLLERGGEVRRADLADPRALADAFAGTDALISNAALYTLDRVPWERFYETNVVGTRHVFQAAHEAGVRRIAYVSTTGVYRTRVFGSVTEDSPRWTERHRNRTWAYMVTKAMAEDIAWTLSETYGTNLSVLRPGGFYGRGDTQLVPRIERFMRWPLLPVPLLRMPFSHVDDIACAIVEALARDEAIGEAFNLSSRPVSLWTLLRTWKSLRGGGPLLLPIPFPLRIHFDSSKAERILGFHDRSLEAAIRDTLSSDDPQRTHTPSTG